MSEIDYRPQQSNILYWRNVANEGRGSQMTQCLHEACDYAAKLETENAGMAELLASFLHEFGDKANNSTVIKARALLAKVEGEAAPY